jgi:hypothetical protein
MSSLPVQNGTGHCHATSTSCPLLEIVASPEKCTSTIFHLFGPLKHHLSAEHFPDNEAVEREVTAWFRQQPKEFYAASFQGLVKRWDKCLNVQGDYVEK